MKLTAIQKTMIFLLVASLAAVLAAWHLSDGEMSVFWLWLNYIAPHLMFVAMTFYFCVKHAIKSADSKACRKRWCVACHNYH